MNAEEVSDSPFGDADANGGGDDPVSGSPSEGPMGRLFDGSAQGPSTTEIREDYGLGKHWAITLRGVLRVATGSGIPPIFEILMGSTMAVAKVAREGGIDVGGDSDDENAAGPQVVEDGS